MRTRPQALDCSGDPNALVIADDRTATPIATVRPGRLAPRPDGTAISLSDVLNSVGEAVYEWDLATDRIRWSNNAPDVLEVREPGQIATGTGFGLLLDPDNLTNRHETVCRSAAQDDGAGRSYQLQYRFLPGGRDSAVGLWIEDTGRWFAGDDGRPRWAHGVVRVINDRHEHEERLAFLARYDPLTGQFNRTRLLEALGASLNHAKRYQSYLVFMLAAIDNLSVINDAYGFDVADEVIGGVARRVRTSMRGGDALGRYSGNKLGLVLNNCSEQEAHVAAERFMREVRDETFDTAAGPVSASVSLAGVLLPRFAVTPHDAMLRAQEAFGELRRRRRSGFVLFEPSSRREAARRKNIATADQLVSALAEERLSLALHPVVDAKTREVTHHEALSRLVREDGTVMAASEFINLAERLGLVRPIDLRSLNLSLDYLGAHPDAKLSVNVSAHTIADPEWFTMLAETATRDRSLVKRLTIEITETAAIRDVVETRDFVASMHDLGVRVAIDDFGAGYTSFVNLKNLRADVLKIDGAFIRGLSQSPEDQMFVKTLADLGSHFGLETVAEWVTDEASADLLASWGVTALQGYLFGEPQLIEGPANAAPLLAKVG
ncbi:MAG: phosphodiesterase [Pseudomonadota bacterium]